MTKATIADGGGGWVLGVFELSILAIRSMRAAPFCKFNPWSGHKRSEALARLYWPPQTSLADIY